MAIKLKNWIRYGFVKFLLFCVILATGTAMIVNFWQFVIDGGESDLTTDYEYSSSYYKTMNTYYEKVYETYLSSDTPKDPETLNAIKGYYYFVHYDSITGFTNAPSAEESSGQTAIQDQESNFYNAIASTHRIDEESSPLYLGGHTYFKLKPQSNRYVLVGMDQTLFDQQRNTYQKAWTQKYFPLMITLFLGILIIVLAMVLLALGAGRKPYSDELHFNTMDWIFGDVYLILWLLAEMAFMGIASELSLVFGESSYLPIAITVAILSGLLGLNFWMSTWKRIKGKCLLRQSLIGLIWLSTFGKLFHWIFQGIKSIKNGPFYSLPLIITFGFLGINILSLLIGSLFIAAFGFFGFLLASSFYLGGIGLLAIYLIYQDQQLDLTIKGLARIKAGDLDYKLDLRGTKPFLRLSEGINEVTEGLRAAVDHEIKSERMKTELITNVSHDLKTPLTSIINYVDLLKTEGLESPDAPHYLEVLDQKSQRLKQLTEDLFEAAKASSGNISVEKTEIRLKDFLHQALAEYEDRFESANLELRLNINEELSLLADGRHLWRVLDNLLNNALKYAAPYSRVYIEAQKSGQMAEIIIKNISAEALNMPAHELMERFKRGDDSRSTEGSGLGLSIAQGLIQHQGGEFSVSIDGDLFKVTLQLPLANKVSPVEPAILA